MKVLVACEYSGKTRDSFIRNGHDAISCDFLPTEDAVEKLFPSILIPETSLVDLLIGIFILTKK